MLITHKYAWITKSYKAYYQNHCNFGSNHYFVSNIIINFAYIFCIPVNMQKSVNFSYGRKQLRIIIYYPIINEFNPNCTGAQTFCDGCFSFKFKFWRTHISWLDSYIYVLYIYGDQGLVKGQVSEILNFIFSLTKIDLFLRQEVMFGMHFRGCLLEG